MRTLLPPPPRTAATTSLSSTAATGSSAHALMPDPAHRASRLRRTAQSARPRLPVRRHLPLGSFPPSPPALSPPLSLSPRPPRALCLARLVPICSAHTLPLAAHDPAPAFSLASASASSPTPLGSHCWVCSLSLAREAPSSPLSFASRAYVLRPSHLGLRFPLRRDSRRPRRPVRPVDSAPGDMDFTLRRVVSPLKRERKGGRDKCKTRQDALRGDLDPTRAIVVVVVEGGGGVGSSERRAWRACAVRYLQSIHPSTAPALHCIGAG